MIPESAPATAEVPLRFSYAGAVAASAAVSDAEKIPSQRDGTVCVRNATRRAARRSDRDNVATPLEALRPVLNAPFCSPV